ncbi:IS110 family transposase [Candidatus Saccharibacteria bacterium]|nr:IS110 family transposase [Candidatus Saccharibacteria bacterium]
MQMGATTNENYNTVYIGMDVHKESFTLCVFTVEMNQPKYTTKIPSEYKMILKYIERMRKIFGDDAEFICGYEAGCLGYALHHNLKKCGIKCIILAPTTMLRESGKRIKTDSRDATLIAKCLAYHTYNPVYVPTKDIEEIKEYIRMRSCHKKQLKRIKQQILAFCLRNDLCFDGTNWTIKHLDWLSHIQTSQLYREILDEYILTYNNLSEKIARIDTRINELAISDTFKEKVDRLICFKGIQTYTAMATISEIGDFNRFPTAEKFAAYLGLVPGESSSGDSINHLGITKAGNNNVRSLLTEAAQSYARGTITAKSPSLKKRQKKNNNPRFLAYVNGANERLQRRFYKLSSKNKKHNVVKIAIARELACFIWGAMTENY